VVAALDVNGNWRVDSEERERRRLSSEPGQSLGGVRWCGWPGSWARTAWRWS
jgi:hypothetical protein